MHELCGAAHSGGVDKSAHPYDGDDVVVDSCG